jgi:two-component system cell cycle sensor histidine kinase/response regulator CckA
MEEKTYVQAELERLFREWFIRVSAVGAVIFLSLSPLDYLSIPDSFVAFLRYRITISLLLAGLSFLAWRSKRKIALRTIAFLAVLLSAVIVEVMILQSGGHLSPHYPGMILLAVVVLGFLPAGIRYHMLLAGTIYGVYALPILLAGEITSPRLFLSRNIFLLCILGAGVVIRHFNLNFLVRVIRLNHEISQQEQHLEEIIWDRTQDLEKITGEWKLTFDSIGEMIAMVDGDGGVVRANRAAALHAGKDVRGIIGTSIFDLFLGDDLPRRLHPLEKMKATGHREETEFLVGETGRWYLASAEPVLKKGGPAGGGVCIVRDITALKHMEEALVKSKDEWEETFNLIEDAITIHSDDFIIQRANAAARKLLGDDNLTIVGRNCFQVFHQTEGPVSGCPSCEAQKTGSTTTVDLYEPTLGKYLEITALPRPGRDGSGGGMIHIVRDITERKDAFDAIDQASRRMQRILEMAPFGIFIVNESGRIEFANPAILRLSGISGKNFTGAMIGDLPGCKETGVGEMIEEAIRGTPFRHGPVEFTCHRGQKKSVGHFTGIPLKELGERKALVFVDDLTELKKAEDDRQELHSLLLQAQKMESIGTLAGGIAHDFNNILTAIINYAGISLTKLEEGNPVRRYLDVILQSSERAAGLTGQLLAFSRKQVLKIRPVDINATVEHLGDMLHRTLGEDIALEFDMGTGVRTVMADQGRIEQIVLNLAGNARDAMPRGGRLTIETTNVKLDDEFIRHHQGVDPGPYVRLVVSDTGEGMSREVQERIFEPFFTTKKTGKGTGLGLATVYGIVNQHRGHINVYSVPGKGSSFSVYLPAASENAEATTHRGTAAGGSETILLVDDEKDILESTAEILQSLGYTVIPAISGEDALRLVDSGAVADLLLTDVVMTGMDGKKLADALLLKYPHMKVLYMSGHLDDKLKAHEVPGPGVEMLEKPLMTDRLARTIRALLDGDGQQGSSGEKPGREERGRDKGSGRSARER